MSGYIHYGLAPLKAKRLRRRFHRRAVVSHVIQRADPLIIYRAIESETKNSTVVFGTNQLGRFIRQGIVYLTFGYDSSVKFPKFLS